MQRGSSSSMSKRKFSMGYRVWGFRDMSGFLQSNDSALGNGASWLAQPFEAGLAG
ncbi:hypothetical protein M407DRAFT_245095 [Tulasnella calospora MUT 4182]|uniref:Uncharacterized protein n=1 Tax=Tulasnella calospora MUT 4182 TaxID=1051891 RepID=A0A0C3QBN6_9AGAM|nr:hypothetical protein M407DRAFT_245095 [Tulasnella calospora MUT 4182]